MCTFMKKDGGAREGERGPSEGEGHKCGEGTTEGRKDTDEDQQDGEESG